MPRTDPGLMAAIRTEYVTSSDRPTLAELASKYGVGKRTLARASSADGWPALRNSYWQQVATTMAASAPIVSKALAEAERDARERGAAALRYIRDGLSRALVEAVRRVVVADGMPEQEAAKVLARWEEMAAKDVLRFLAQAPQALAAVIKALELVSGRPTERVEHAGPPIELTPEEEELLNRLWDQVRLSDAGA